MSIYCVYLTVYHGNKLPPYYIGSSTVDRVNKGYHGSVRSKKYKNIWMTELKNNPQLFKTYIVSELPTKKESILKERYYHTKLNVVLSPMYINQAIASPDGCYGTEQSGKNNPMYGKSPWNKGKKNAQIPWNKDKKDCFNGRGPWSGKKLTTKHCDSMRKANTERQQKLKSEGINTAAVMLATKMCEHCKMSVTLGNYARWHGPKCKSIRPLI